MFITSEVLCFLFVVLHLLSSKAVEEEEWIQRTNISVYYESLCPDCQDFITEQMAPAFLKMKSYINIKLVPYGNAVDHYDNRTRKWTTTCQHGPKECDGNKIAACAIDELRNNENIINFIYCMSTSMEPEDIVQKCATKLHIEYNTIKSCYTGYKGELLQRHFGNLTRMVKPKIKSVPAIAVNQVYNISDQESLQTNFTGAICKHIKGPKPAACTKK